ncbi:unnamed protein product [Rotaria sp. Silwood1]|nr:unnamed protein product [Rotaria sp. Silwood1]CAF1651263.1 unnamed protein product [Rotaria sp. Silwood1]
MHPKKCVDIVCYICLQHNDHNVVSSSLETHEIILKYSNLFDFDQLLISTQVGSIEENRVSEALKTRIELLEDSIQHTTSSYVLAKVSLAQLIDDIDFRILTYLEQQLKQQYPDIRVRQAIASTFAKLDV